MAEQQFPEPIVGALIFNTIGKLFLMKSHKWGGNYVIPGGHIELGESAVNALKREIKEETGLDIFDIEFIGIQEFIFDPAFWKKRHFVFMDYACKTDSRDVTLNSEGQEFGWVSLDEFERLPVEPYTLCAIQNFKAMRQNTQLLKKG
ncbi:MAG: NUDIX domain-containing protein [Nanoarchaeota archaeon]|nr:NUDIX domain-containing protein [Nanoarchaeota archaeon]MBU4301091.1 NUDIX domain-containing protein [Nanoarchaeota archaeon]MBU4451907.1 NUDIX domain-containing protein [Nanoarchaeota archaeon]MCG2724608.1 NUDIX domain-containing protein [archaeon]